MSTDGGCEHSSLIPCYQCLRAQLATVTAERDQALTVLSEADENAAALREEHNRMLRRMIARFPTRREGVPEYECARHGTESCPSCLAYLMGDLRAALTPEVKGSPKLSPNSAPTTNPAPVSSSPASEPKPDLISRAEVLRVIREQDGHVYVISEIARKVEAL